MRTGLKDKVLALYRERPEATSQELADALDCHSAYVRSTLKRQGLSIYRAHDAHREKPIKVTVSRQHTSILAPYAEKRSMSVRQLIDRLIGVIAADNLVDPLLDDEF